MTITGAAHQILRARLIQSDRLIVPTHQVSDLRVRSHQPSDPRVQSHRSISRRGHGHCRQMYLGVGDSFCLFVK